MEIAYVRKRVQFSDFEKSLLLHLITKYPIVMVKSAKRAVSEKKEEAWRALLEEFLAKTLRTDAITTRQLRKLYFNLKGLSKKDDVAETNSSNVTFAEAEHFNSNPPFGIVIDQIDYPGPARPTGNLSPVQIAEKRKEMSSYEREAEAHAAKMLVYETQVRCMREEHLAKLELYELQKQVILKQLNS